jgi:hypothetical protein
VFENKESSVESILTVTYAAYLAISIGLTVWVGRTLFRHGRTFLVDAFGGNEPLADSVNHLLVVGFYLLNLGWVCLMMREPWPPDGAANALELLSRKIGWVLLVLGTMHFFNVYVVSRIRRGSAQARVGPSILPAASA